jgi:YaiO family outer membrane protein
MSSVAARRPHMPRRTLLAVHIVLSLLAGVIAAGSEAQEWQAAIRAEDYGRARAALEQALLAQPADAALRYELARVLGYLGLAESALAEFDALLALHPENADYLLGRAQMLARLGQDAAAIETTERASSLAPDYEEVWELRLRLAERVDDDAVTTALRQDIAIRFPNASWWQRPAAATEHTRWISVDWGGDRLSNDAPHWSRRSIRLDWDTPAGASFYGDVARAERFDRADSSFSVGGAWQALPQWHLGAGLTATADAEFEPTRDLSIEASRPWSHGWGSELRYRRREYPTSTVASYSFTGDKYFSDYRIAYRIDHSRLLGAGSSTGHSLILGWYPSETRSFGLTLGTGEEIETIGLDQLLSTRVSSATLNGRQTLSSRFSLSWWLGTHRQGDFYRRRYGGLSVRVGI